MTKSARPGASRLEILVITGIASVVVCLVTVGTLRVRVEADRAACRNNLRQIHAAVLSYVEYQECFPGPDKGASREVRDSWKLSESLGIHAPDLQIFVCPSDTVSATEEAPKGSYRYNRFFWRRKMEQLDKDRLARWEWLVKDRHLVHGLGTPVPKPPKKDEEDGDDEEKPKPTIPDLRANVLFFDGRVK